MNDAVAHQISAHYIITNRIYILIYLSLCCLHGLSGQNRIQGKVLDSNHQPLGYANILLMATSDSSLVKGDLSNEYGLFEIGNIGTEDYYLHIDMIGFGVERRSVVFDKQGVFNSGDIILRESSTMLDEVQIVAKKPLFEQKVDRMIINVANSISNTGGTALEVLEKSPGVAVNRQTNSITMNGKNGVIIMINGKISRLPDNAIKQMLEGMSSANIEKVELIHTPPANFDAEGNAGIINIVMIKNADMGTNGNYSLSIGYGKKEKAGASLNVNHRVDKINLFGDYSYSYDNNPQYFTNYRKFIYDGVTVEDDGESFRDDTKTQTHNARIGIDYEVSDRTTLGMVVGASYSDWKMNALGINRTLEDGIVTHITHMPNDEINQWKGLVTNINVTHKFSSTSSMSFDIDYAAYNNDNPSNYDITYSNGQGQEISQEKIRLTKDTPIDIWVAKLDFGQSVSEKLNISYGLKASLSGFNNNIVVDNDYGNGWVQNPDYTADYRLDEDILSAYGDMNASLTSALSLKFGLRYEHTTSHLGTTVNPDIVDRKYGRLFPSLFLSQKLTESSQINASYSRRINRPSFRHLAPYVIFYSPTTFETGNSALQPSFTDAYKIDYAYKANLISIQYSRENDAISWITFVDESKNQQINNIVNLDLFQNYGVNLSIPINITSFWELRSNISLNWNKLDYVFEGRDATASRNSWRYNGTSNIKLSKSWDMEVSGNYRSKTLDGIFISRPMGTLNFGIQKSLPSGSKIRFAVSDIFLTGNWTGEATQPELNYEYLGRYNFSERTFRLTFSNSFGSNKVKAKRQRETGSAEEQRRVN